MTTDVRTPRSTRRASAAARSWDKEVDIETPSTRGEPASFDGSVVPIRATGDSRAVRPAERVQYELSRRLRRRRAAILDLDGTLVDSNEAHALAWLVSLHDFGHDVSLDLLRPLIGMAHERILHHAIGALHDPDESRQILERRAQIFSTWYMPRLLPFVGTRALLQRMKRGGLKLVVASAAKPDETTGLVRAAAIEDLVDEVVTAADADSWPESDVVATALAKTGCSPETVVLLGDTPYDIAASVRVGIDAVALRSGGWRDSALRGAVAVFNDAVDLLRNYSSSPFFCAATTTPYVSPQLTLVQ
jgi:beta-phosphoglucomutase-like phosphatase (HAD superfamily)